MSLHDVFPIVSGVLNGLYKEHALRSRSESHHSTAEENWIHMLLAGCGEPRKKILRDISRRHRSDPSLHGARRIRERRQVHVNTRHEPRPEIVPSFWDVAGHFMGTQELSANDKVIVQSMLSYSDQYPQKKILEMIRLIDAIIDHNESSGKNTDETPSLCGWRNELSFQLFTRKNFSGNKNEMLFRILKYRIRSEAQQQNLVREHGMEVRTQGDSKRFFVHFLEDEDRTFRHAAQRIRELLNQSGSHERR